MPALLPVAPSPAASIWSELINILLVNHQAANHEGQLLTISRTWPTLIIASNIKTGLNWFTRNDIIRRYMRAINLPRCLHVA